MPTIVGHKRYGDDPGIFIHRNKISSAIRMYGIDTGCCHGDELSALLLPDFEVISVRSQAEHWSKQKMLNANLKPVVQKSDSMTLEDIEEQIHLLRAEPDLDPEEEVYLQRLEKELQRTNSALEDIVHYCMGESERILENLSAITGFNDLPDGERKLRFASMDVKDPLVRYIHKAHDGYLDVPYLRMRLTRLKVYGAGK